jgi:hypothetical protein
MSGEFERWAKGLRLGFLGEVGKRIMGGLAASFGDRARELALQGVLEHMPEFASAEANALTASERQIEAGATETNEHLAQRLIDAIPTHRLAATALGFLLALEGVGYDYDNGRPVLVQQNGRAFFLVPAATALPDYTVSRDVPNRDDVKMFITTLGANPFVHGDFAGSPLTATAPIGSTSVFVTDTTPFRVGGYLALDVGTPFLILTINTGTGEIELDTGGTAVGHPAGNNAIACDSDGIPFYPWLLFDLDDDFCSRFSLIFSTVPSSWTDVQDPPTELTAPTSAEVNQIRRLGNRWRGGKATFVSIVVPLIGELWDWPVGIWDDGGLWDDDATGVTWTTTET